MFVFQFILSFNRHKQNHSKVSNYFMLFEVKTRKKNQYLVLKSLLLLEATIFWHTPGFHLCTYRQQNKKAI